MATRVGCCKIWLTSFDSLSLKTPVRRKHLGDISYMSRLQPILSYISLPWQQWLVVVEFGCDSLTPKIPCYTQRARDISFYNFWRVVSYHRRNHPRHVRGLRLPQIRGFPLTLNVAITTVLRSNVLHCEITLYTIRIQGYTRILVWGIRQTL